MKEFLKSRTLAGEVNTKLLRRERKERTETKSPFCLPGGNQVRATQVVVGNEAFAVGLPSVGPWLPFLRL